MKLRRLMTTIRTTPWVITEDRLHDIADVLLRRARGHRLSPEEIAEVIGTPGDQHAFDVPGAHLAGTGTGGARKGGTVAVIPLWGIVHPRASDIDDVSGPGGFSVEGARKVFSKAVNDPNVRAIVLDIDSPGGMVPGVEQFSDDIFAAREKKPVIAVANHLAASAAFWIASAASEFVVTPGGEVGSVGVFTMHVDQSGALEQEGLKVDLIYEGPHKVEGNPFGPLSDEARDFLQGQVKDTYQRFIGALARNRGVSASHVRKEFGGGRVLHDKQAKAAGMVDRIDTLENTIRRAVSGRIVRSARQRSPASGVIPRVLDAPNRALRDSGLHLHGLPIYRESFDTDAHRFQQVDDGSIIDLLPLINEAVELRKTSGGCSLVHTVSIGDGRVQVVPCPGPDGCDAAKDGDWTPPLDDDEPAAGKACATCGVTPIACDDGTLRHICEATNPADVPLRVDCEGCGKSCDPAFVEDGRCPECSTAAADHVFCGDCTGGVPPGQLSEDGLCHLCVAKRTGAADAAYRARRLDLHRSGS